MSQEVSEARLRVVVVAIIAALVGLYLLVVLSALPGCGPAERTLELEGETITGITSGGIRWIGPAWLAGTPQTQDRFAAIVDDEREELAFELDASSKGERSFLVVIRSGVFTVGRLRVGGSTHIDRRVIELAYAGPGKPIVPSARHEFHHVELFRSSGDPDAAHLDPSWRELEATPSGGARPP